MTWENCIKIWQICDKSPILWIHRLSQKSIITLTLNGFSELAIYHNFVNFLCEFPKSGFLQLQHSCTEPSKRRLRDSDSFLKIRRKHFPTDSSSCSQLKLFSSNAGDVLEKKGNYYTEGDGLHANFKLAATFPIASPARKSVGDILISASYVKVKLPMI